MHTLWICLFIVLGLLAAVFGLGCLLAAISMRIQRQSLQEAWSWQAAHYDLSWYGPLEKEDYQVKSYDGYALHVELLRNPKPTDRYVLISHGYTDNRYGALKYAKNYLDFGFHVLIYDLRGHGENEKTFCTYSVREGRDLDALVRDSRARYPDARLFGLHGESLGAATSIASLKYDPPVDFVVSDCGFSEIKSVLQVGMRAMHLPAGLVNLASPCAKLLYGFSYQQMRPIESLPGTKLPILLLHGAKDDFILPAHAEAMHRAAADHSELHLIPEAPHAISCLTDPPLYRQYQEDFLARHHFLNEKMKL